MITTPKDMAYDTATFDRAVTQFETQLRQSAKGQSHYHLVIEGELDRNTCERIKQLYKTAGWAVVVCRTSSETGERSGLTGLQLTIPS